MSKETKKTSAEAIERLGTPDDSLNEALLAVRNARERLNPQVAKAYDRLVERLSTIDSRAIGPAAGAAMPDFALPDRTGQVVTLKSLLARGAAVISFNRGRWCPYCRLDLKALAAAQPEVERLGGQIVSIMPDLANSVANASDALPFPVLSDVDLGYTLSLDLVYWVGSEVTTHYRALGIDLEKYHGNGAYFLPITAKFIVGTDGIVKSRFVDVEFRQRVAIARIMAVLESQRYEPGL